MGEEPEVNQRRFPRLNTTADYLLHVYRDDRLIEGARIQNISAVGCAIQVPSEEAVGLAPGTVLDPLYVDHPELPLVPFQGSVAWVLGRAAARSGGYVVAGVEFTAVTRLIQQLIQQHVEEASL